MGQVFEHKWFFRAAVALLLTFQAVVMVRSSRLECNTFDEAVHLSAGYFYHQVRDYYWNSEHPPMTKLLAAWPLLALDLRIPKETAAWRGGDLVSVSEDFLFRNRAKPDTLLLLGRLPTMLVTLLMGLVLAIWTRRRFGAPVALCALLLCCTDPNLTAHGRYVTSDVPATCIVFLTVLAWLNYLEGRKLRWLALTGLAAGLALATKFSTVSVLVILPLIGLIQWILRRKEFSMVRLVVSTAAVVAAALLVLKTTYWPDASYSTNMYTKANLSDYVDKEKTAGKIFAWVGDTLELKMHPYTFGMYLLAEHAERGHPAYLLGKRSEEGRLLYFPVAFAVKTPTALLALLLAALAAAFVAAFRREGWGSQVQPIIWFGLLVPPLVMFLIAMAANINIGVRHILPIYPFMIVIAAAATTRRALAPLLLLVFALHAYEYTRVAPHYLAFFNTIAGGPDNGVRYLSDSNIDWGQDAKKLKRYLRSEGDPPLCLSYFGSADLEYYGLSSRGFPWTEEIEKWGYPNCVAAISATAWQATYGRGSKITWTREEEPTRKIGYSIFVYDLRERSTR